MLISSCMSSSSGPSEPAPSEVQPIEPADDDAGLTLANRVVNTAIGVMGEPYRWGGTSTEDGFDCSGLVWYSYRMHGVTVPRVSRDQARAGQGVPRRIEDLESGDILLFANGGSTVTHVGLYIGDARFIHATTSGGVRVGTLAGAGNSNDRWWRDRWVGARRIWNQHAYHITNVEENGTVTSPEPARTFSANGT